MRAANPGDFALYIQAIDDLATKAIGASDLTFSAAFMEFCRTGWPGPSGGSPTVFTENDITNGNLGALGAGDVLIANTAAKLIHLKEEVPTQILRDSMIVINANIQRDNTMTVMYSTGRGPTWEVKGMANVNPAANEQPTVAWVVVVDENEQ
jgi:hypothetical protein